MGESKPGLVKVMGGVSVTFHFRMGECVLDYYYFFFFGKQGNFINYKTLVAAPVLQSLGRQKPISSSANGCTTTEGGK